MNRGQPSATLFPYTPLFRAFEARDTVRIEDTGWQHLHGHVAIQSRITRTIHLTHAATPEQRHHLVRADSLTDVKRHSLDFGSHDRKSTRLNSSHATISYAVF